MRSKDLPYYATFDRRFIDESWLARREEVIFDRERPIVDPHHHIWTAPRPAYSADDLLDDLTAGHNVRATIYMESGEHWHRTGPEHLRSVGETSHALDIAQQYSNSSGPKVAAGIISHADLTLGRDSEATLHAHRQAGGTHFKGVRAYLFWDEKIDIGIANPAKDWRPRRPFARALASLRHLDWFATSWHITRTCPRSRNWPPRFRRRTLS
jgi:hypothetical protein